MRTVLIDDNILRVTTAGKSPNHGVSRTGPGRAAIRFQATDTDIQSVGEVVALSRPGERYIRIVLGPWQAQRWLRHVSL